MMHRQMGIWIVRVAVLMGSVGLSIELPAWAQTRANMMCYDVYVPSYAHPCACFIAKLGDDPHTHDVCSAAVPKEGDVTAKLPYCVDVQGQTCVTVLGKYDCGDVMNCAPKWCDTVTNYPNTIQFKDCKPTNKGSCKKAYGTC